MFQDLNWTVPFVLGFLFAVIIWLGFAIIRFWLDIRKTKKEILNDDFINESVVLTGQEPMRVIDMLKMLVEMLGLSEGSIEFKDEKYAGHYVRTPYAYQPKLGRKYIPPMHVDLGQGLLQLINEISTKK